MKKENKQGKGECWDKLLKLKVEREIIKTILIKNKNIDEGNLQR